MNNNITLAHDPDALNKSNSNAETSFPCPEMYILNHPTDSDKSRLVHTNSFVAFDQTLQVSPLHNVDLEDNLALQSFKHND